MRILVDLSMFDYDKETEAKECLTQEIPTHSFNKYFIEKSLADFISTENTVNNGIYTYLYIYFMDRTAPERINIYFFCSNHKLY